MPNQNNNLLKTLAFFDLFNYPLTAWELWCFNPDKQSYKETLEQINQTVFRRQDGFYFLNNQSLIITRQNRYNLADKKFKLARRAAWFFSRLPWIELVALVNSIGSHNLRAEGDLDFFIVTKPKRLWLSRLIITSWLKILNLRPTAKKNQNTFCLSFWVDSENLNLNNYRLNNDPYFSYWLACLNPLFDKNQKYSRLIEANPWLNRELPNWQPLQPLSEHLLSINQKIHQIPAFAEMAKKIFVNFWIKFLNSLELLAKKLQLKIMPPQIKNLANQDTRVVINDGVIKLHPLDRRQFFQEKHQEILSRYENKNF